MIRINQIKVSIQKMSGTKSEQEAKLLPIVAKEMRMDVQSIKSLTIVKRSIDARHKDDIKYIYAVDVSVDNEGKFLKKNKNRNIIKGNKHKYTFQPVGMKPLEKRPVIVGTGPAGLFCAYMLAEAGYRPIVLERGEDVDTRKADVNTFWETNVLKEHSNVQFGEGGAGTFSDGKLNTMVKDEFGRGKKVLEIFVKHGAPEDILYLNKPHIGTDHLIQIVKSMREHIKELGGEVRFASTVTDVQMENGSVSGVEVNHEEIIPADIVVLAIGHSARDTFEMLYQKGVDMQSKSFAIGVRIEHPQSIIDHAQYGDACQMLPAADYKVTHQAETNRGVYSFCMCPGGFVVNSSSEQGHLVVNGMSNYMRNEKNANSAMIVTVNPDDFDGNSPLAGMNFQRKWEKLAYETGKGKIPVQLFGDLCNNRESTSFGAITPNIKGQYMFGNLNHCLPDYVVTTLKEGIHSFDRRIPGFANEEAILSGVETRTSSPIRMNRGQSYESVNVAGLYPCGEGAGYAGGITSAAMDGMKVYEAIASVYKR